MFGANVGSGRLSPKLEECAGEMNDHLGPQVEVGATMPLTTGAGEATTGAVERPWARVVTVPTGRRIRWVDGVLLI